LAHKDGEVTPHVIDLDDKASEERIEVAESGVSDVRYKK
jgi:hypothetical protein